MNLALPAEWEKHEAAWLVWPKRSDDWPGKFSSIKWIYSDIIKTIADSEIVRLIVDSKEAEKKARAVLNKAGVNLTGIEFYHFKSDRSWIRDYGPFFVRSKSGIKTLRFNFNGWAKYAEWEHDNDVAEKITNELDFKYIDAEYHGSKIVLEGGSIDVNGKGTLITTKQCLLNKSQQIRNSDFDKNDYEKIFKKYFGVTNTIWLNEGIAGDDTNGHIDDTCRFVNKDTVAACHEPNPDDINYKSLNENMEILQNSRLENASKLNIINLPMPEPKYFDGYRLPASYANFYICNSNVLVPTFNDPNDYKAIGILSEIFNSRKLIGINCTDLIWGFGAIHCITKEQYAI
jgi:agmatine deiminase